MWTMFESFFWKVTWWKIPFEIIWPLICAVYWWQSNGGWRSRRHQKSYEQCIEKVSTTAIQASGKQSHYIKSRAWRDFYYWRYLPAQLLYNDFGRKSYNLFCPRQLIDLDVSNFEYLFWFSPLRLLAESTNKYLIFKIRHVLIDELQRTQISCSPDPTTNFENTNPTFFEFLDEYTKFYQFSLSWSKTVRLAIRVDKFMISIFGIGCWIRCAVH